MGLSRKHNFFIAILFVFVFFLGFLPAQTVLAKNAGSGTKAFNFIGYRCLDPNYLQVFFDKSIPQYGVEAVEASQFKIFKGSDTSGDELAVEKVDVGNDSNVTAVGLSQGSSVILNTAAEDDFIPGTTYTVVLNNTITSNSGGGNGLTLGSYLQNQDVIFSFTAPDDLDTDNVGNTNNANGRYESIVPGIINTYPENGAVNVSIEESIYFSLNVPAADPAAVKNGMILEKYDTGSESWLPLTYDETIDTSADGQIYAPLASDDQTFFYFPMTGSDSKIPYNLELNTKYRLYIPEITLINGQTIPASDQPITFTTAANDTVLRAGITIDSVKYDGENVELSWTAPSLTSVDRPVLPIKYNVYVGEDHPDDLLDDSYAPYWNFNKLNAQPILSAAYTVTGLMPGIHYFFRVTPLNGTNEDGYSEGGYSNYMSATIPIPSPQVIGAETNEDGSKVIITFNKAMAAMADPSAQAAQFRVDVGGTDDPVQAVELNTDPSKIELTLETPVTFANQDLTVTYTTGTLTAADGGFLANFSRSVTNNVPGVRSAETNTTGSRIIITFNKAMADPAGNEAAFTVHAGSGTEQVTAVARDTDTSKINLTLNSNITKGKDVTLDYKVPPGTVKATDKGVLADFRGLAIENKSNVTESGGGGGGGGDPNVKLPTVETLQVSAADIKASKATVKGNVTSDGGDTISERGIAYATSSNPTISNSVLEDSTGGTGTFSLELSGLTSSTLYHARAYATNSAGTAYGTDVSFTTGAANPINLVGVYITTAQDGDATSDTGDEVTDGSTVPKDAIFKLIFDKNVTNPNMFFNGKSVLANNKDCILLQTSSESSVPAHVFMVGTGLPGDEERTNLFLQPNSDLTVGQGYKIIVLSSLIANNGLTIGHQESVTFTASSNSSGSSPKKSETPMVSTTVAAATGGTVQSSDGTQVVIPAGAIVGTSTSLDITISEDLESTDPATPGITFYNLQNTERSFGPTGTTFKKPVTISLPFGNANIPAADYPYLAIYIWQGGCWQKVGGVVDPVKKTVSVPVSHFSSYRIMADKTANAVRTGGSDRYETAVKIAQNNFATGADYAVLARGDISADSLTAVPLARHFNAPLLLTPQNYLPDAVLKELKALRVKKVYLIGGEQVVGAKVAQAITSQGISIQRVAGPDRYGTAYQVAKLLGNIGQAVIVNGTNNAYPDALSVSSWAAYNGAPILYADGTDVLPADTKKALTELNVVRTIFVGGTGVLPSALEKLTPNPERYAGADRYGTNVAVLSKLQAGAVKVFGVTGTNFADALAGAAVAGQSNGWLLLTGSSQNAGKGLTTEQIQMLQAAKGKVLVLNIFGGTGAVPDAVVNNIKANLGL